MTTREKILDIVQNTIQREGRDNLIYHLETKNDFFKAPCSTKYHNDYEGGLADHSLNVYNALKEKVQHYGIDVSEESVAICGLFHDMCKTDFYTTDKVWTKETGRWEQKDAYVVNDLFPSGHGEKSVFLLQKFMSLTDQEILAIRWHMIAFDASIHFNYPNGFPFRKAMDEEPLVCLLATADMEASTILEK